MMHTSDEQQEATSVELKPYTERGFAKTAVSAVIALLRLFLSDTLAKRVACIVLLAAGMPDSRIAVLTETGERTVRRYRKELSNAAAEEDVTRLLSIKKPSRTRSKTWGMQEEILDEIDRHNCRTRQEAAQIIKEKFGIELSVTAVGKLLKKGGSSNGSADHSQPKQT